MRKKNQYVTQEQLREELIKSRELGHPTELLVDYANRIFKKYQLKPNWNQYTFLEDARSRANVSLLTYWRNIEPEGNPFSYLTAIIHTAMLYELQDLKKQKEVKDALCIEMGHNITGFDIFEEEA